MPRRFALAAIAVLLCTQVAVSFWGIDDVWLAGHSSWNSAAYQQSARNTLRFGNLYPARYHYATTPPDKLYTHGPLALHLHTTFAHWALGEDAEWITRLMPALHGVFAACMLAFLLWRWTDPVTAVVGLAIFVALPINIIYANMSNHALGAIAWGLLMFHGLFLWLQEDDRRGIWLALIGFWMMSAWNWTAYYVAAVVGLVWFMRIFFGPRSAETRGFRASLLPWIAYCAVVVTAFASHFLLVAWSLGGLDELRGTFEERQKIDEKMWERVVEQVPPLMYSEWLMAIGALWIVWLLVRLARGRGRWIDLCACAFLSAGALHFFVFRNSSVVHEYWTWEATVFAAIAGADMTRRLTDPVFRFMRRRWPSPQASYLLQAGAMLALLYPFFAHSLEVSPPGKHFGGSMWFFAPHRGHVQRYDADRLSATFAKLVHDRTTRQTGVLLRTKLNRRFRFFITLDRELHFQGLGEPPTPQGKITEWVRIGDLRRTSRASLKPFIQKYAYLEAYPFFMLDYRKPRGPIEILREHVPEQSLWSKYIHHSFEPPITLVLDAKATAELDQQLRKQ